MRTNNLKKELKFLRLKSKLPKWEKSIVFQRHTMLRATSLPYFTNTPSCLFVAKATHRFPLTREIGSSDLTLLHLFPFHITKGVLFLIHIIYLRSFLIDHSFHWWKPEHSIDSRNGNKEIKRVNLPKKMSWTERGRATNFKANLKGKKKLRPTLNLPKLRELEKEEENKNPLESLSLNLPKTNRSLNQSKKIFPIPIWIEDQVFGKFQQKMRLCRKVEIVQNNKKKKRWRVVSQRKLRKRRMQKKAVNLSPNSRFKKFSSKEKFLSILISLILKIQIWRCSNGVVRFTVQLLTRLRLKTTTISFIYCR